MINAKKKQRLINAAFLCCIFAAFLCLPSIANAQDITTGLIGHWKLDETSGTTIADSSGNGNDGTISGINASARSAHGVIKNAMLADGVSGTGLNLGEMPMTANSHSMAFWFFIDPNGSGSDRIFSRNSFHFFQISDSDNDGLYTYDIRLRDTSANGPGFCFHDPSCDVLEAGKWNHFAIVSDVANTSLYLNGSLLSAGASANFDLNTDDLRFGINGEAFEGMWDDIRIYNRPLAADDVAAIYETASCPKETDSVGVTSEIIYNENYRIMQYCDGHGWESMGKGASILHGQKTEGNDYNINAVEFDGTNDYLTHGALTGAADTKSATISAWIKKPNDGNQLRIFSGDSASNGSFNIWLGTGGLIRMSATNSSNTIILDKTGGGTALDDDNWHHILISFDLTNASNRHIYVDGVEETNFAIYTDDFIALSNITSTSVGSDISGGNRFDGEIADVWIDFGTYIDLSVEANRRKFINADGQAINLGSNGELPTGSAPDIFLSGDTDSWHTNKGTGGGFTENGALTDATTLPPSETARKLVGWWRLDETTGTTAADSSGNGNDGTMVNSLTADTSSISGVVSNGLAFLDNNEIINVTDNPSIDITGQWSASAWMKADRTASTNFALRKNNSYILSLAFPSNEVCAGVAGASFCGGTYPDDDEWHHIAASYNDQTDTITLYVDGVSVASNTSYADVMTTSNDNFVIGDGAGRLPQAIDDVRVYNFALDANQIAELYAASSDFYQPNAVYFDNSIEYVSRDGDLTGLSDSKQLTASFWVYRDVDKRVQIYDGGGAGQNAFTIFNGTNYIRLSLQNAAGTQIMQCSSNTSTLSIGQWHHVLISFDLSNPSNRHIYINDSAELSSCGTYVDDIIDFTKAQHVLPDSAVNYLDGSLADVWIDFGKYIDLSREANRRKFIDENGGAVYLGANGEIPTGASPDIFLSGDTATWHTNKGTGGGFTENGALTDATTAPPGAKQPRYCSNPSQPEGTLIYNSDEEVMQYCDGYVYRPLGPQGDGGGGCSNPTGVAGMMFYNTDFATLMYCEGDEWIGVGRDGIGLALSNGLIGHWKLDETSGTTAIDSSDNGNDGTYVNITPASQSISGPNNSAMTFGSSNGSIQVPNIPAYDITDEITLSAWAIVKDSGWNRLIGRPSGTGDYILQYESTINSLCFTLLGGAGGACGSFNADSASWYHFAATYNDAEDEIILYVNGNEVNTVTTTDTITVSSNGIYSGFSDGFNPQAADDLRIYDRVLSAGEIQALYNLGDCPAIGDTCNDGTIYAGLSPDENLPMYSTPADAPGTYSWNDGNTDYTTTGATDNDDGDGNTSIIIATDSNSVDPGTQQHNAAQYCSDLNAHGYTDWYLPSRSESGILGEMIVIKDGNPSSTIGLWGSDELSQNNAFLRYINTDGSLSTGNNAKSENRIVRCVRK